MTRAILSFLIGAIYLGFLDWLQSYCGVEIYPVSFWEWLKIPLEFGILTLFLSQAIRWFEGNVEFEKIKSSLAEAVFELFFFAGLYIITCVYVLVPSYLIVILFLGLTLSKCFITYKEGDWKYFVILGGLGPVLESLLVNWGTFKYYHADMFGIPYWLPLLWGNGGLLARRLWNLPQLKWRI